MDVKSLLKQLTNEIEDVGTLEWGAVSVEEVQKPLRTIHKILEQILEAVSGR